MANPIVITDDLNILAIVGAAITPVVLWADNMELGGDVPATWSCADLPAGLSLRTYEADAAPLGKSGTMMLFAEVYGTPTTAGYPTSDVVATNSSGSDTADIQWAILSAPVGTPTTGTLWDDLEINIDLGTRRASIPGLQTGEDGILFYCAKGDKFNLFVGLEKYEVLQDVKPGSETVTIRVAGKEFEEERVIELASGTAAKEGLYDYARFRIPFEVTPANWALLADYEGDRSTGRAFPWQIEVAVDGASYFRICTDSFRIGLKRDQIAD